MNRVLPRMTGAALALLVWFAVGAHAAHDLWAASVFFLVVTILAVIFCIDRMRTKAPFQFPFWSPAATGLVAVLLSGWFSFDLSAYRQEVWGWFFMIVAYGLFVNTVQTLDERRAFFRLAGAVILPLLGYCLWQQSTLLPANYGHLTLPMSITSRPLTISYGHWEIHGTLLNSIVLAGFMLNWPLLWWADRRKTRWAWVLGLCTLATLFLARSWWAFIALSIGALIDQRHTFMVHVKKHRVALVALAGAAFAGLAFLIWFKAQQAIEGSSYSAGSRWVYWLTAVHVWKHHPWTGVGLGGYPMAFQFFKAGAAQNTLFAHSLPLQWLAETGMVGVFAAVIVGVCVWTQRHRFDNQTPYAPTIVAVLCFSLININMEYLLNKYVLLLLFAASLDLPSFRSYTVRPFWWGLSAACFVLIAPLWIANYAASRVSIAGQALEQSGNFIQAIKHYQDAISLDSSQADSAIRLSQIYWTVYLNTHDKKAYDESLFYLRWSLKERKDPVMLHMLDRYTLK